MAASNIVMRRAVGVQTSAPEAQGRGEGLKQFAAGAQGFAAQEAKLRPAAADAKGDGVQMREAEPNSDRGSGSGGERKAEPAAAKHEEGAAAKEVSIPKPDLGKLDEKLDASAAKTGDALAQKATEIEKAPKESPLEVSQPGDAVEKEAEAVAAKVMAPEQNGAEVAKPAGDTKAAAQGNESCAECGGAMKSEGGGEPECSTCGTKSSEQGGGGDGDGDEKSTGGALGKVMKKAAKGVMRKVSRVGAPVQRRVGAVQAKSAGDPLSSDVRGAVEPVVGADLGNVRVHSDSAAVQKSEAIGAKAFTSGSDIFLGAGASASDKGLMAHEATHVVQQSAAPTQRQVQRLGVEDFIPDSILNAVRGLAGQGSTYSDGLGSRADTAKNTAKSQAEQVPGQAKGEATAAETSAKSAGAAAKSTVDSGAAAARSAGAQAATEAASQAKQVDAAGPLATYASDPVRSKVEGPPASLGRGGGGAGGAAAQAPAPAQGGGGGGAAAPNAGATMAGAGAAPGGVGAWDCDGASIVAKVTDMGRDVVAGMTQAMRGAGLGPVMDLAARGVAQAQQTVAQISAGIDNVKNQVTQWLDETTAPVRETITRLTEEANAAYEQAKAAVSAEVDRVKTWAAGKWTDIKAAVSQGIEDAINWAKNGASSLMSQARALVGRLWDMLPDGLKSALTSAVSTVEGWVSSARAGIGEVQNFVTEKSTEFQAWALEKANGATSWLGEQYVEVKQMATDASTAVGEAWTSAKQTATDLASQAYTAADNASGGRITRWRDAAAEKAAQLRGEACTLAGDYVGPCIEKALPDPTQEGQTSFASLALTGDLTVPIEGVPVKVAAGASIKIEKADSKYTATLTGEGSIGVALELSGGGGGGGGGSPVSLSMEGTLPEKVLGMQAIGAGPMPGVSGDVGGGGGGGGASTSAAGGGGGGSTTTPAAGGGGGAADPAAAGGGGGGMEAGVEAGYKCTVEVVYEFDASPAKANSCAGLGGLAALLVSQGAGAILPQPFGSMAQSAGSFIAAENLKSAKMELAQTVGASASAEAEGVGGGEIKAEGEAGVSVGMERADGQTTMTASLFQRGSVEGELKLEPHGFALASIGGSISSEAELEVGYNTTTEVVSADFTTKAGASVALGGIRNLLAAIPGAVRGIVEPKLNEYGISGATHDGEIGVELESTTDLAALATAIDGELSKGRGATATGLWTAVKTWYAQSRTTTYKVELTATEKVLAAEISGGGDGVKATAGVEATRGLTTELASGTI